MNDARTRCLLLSVLGSRHFLRRRDGTALEGWIEDVADEAMRFTSGGPLSSWALVEVPLQEVDWDTAAYFDDARERWVDVRWSAAASDWVERPLRR